MEIYDPSLGSGPAFLKPENCPSDLHLRAGEDSGSPSAGGPGARERRAGTRPAPRASPPHQLPEKRVQQREDEVHRHEPVQLLAHEVLPALTQTRPQPPGPRAQPTRGLPGQKRSRGCSSPPPPRARADPPEGTGSLPPPPAPPGPPSPGPLRRPPCGPASGSKESPGRPS